MTRIVLDFDPAVLAALRLGPDAFSDELKTAAVVQWYAERRISQSRAGEILGISRARLLDELWRRGVPAIQVTEGELEREVHGDL